MAVQLDRFGCHFAIANVLEITVDIEVVEVFIEVDVIVVVTQRA